MEIFETVRKKQIFLSVLAGFSQLFDHSGTVLITQDSTLTGSSIIQLHSRQSRKLSVFSREGRKTQHKFCLCEVDQILLAKGLWNIMTLRNYNRFEFKVSDEKKLWNRGFKPRPQLPPQDSEDHLHLYGHSSLS